MKALVLLLFFMSSTMPTYIVINYSSACHKYLDCKLQSDNRSAVAPQSSSTTFLMNAFQTSNSDFCHVFHHCHEWFWNLEVICESNLNTEHHRSPVTQYCLTTSSHTKADDEIQCSWQALISSVSSPESSHRLKNKRTRSPKPFAWFQWASESDSPSPNRCFQNEFLRTVSCY